MKPIDSGTHTYLSSRGPTLSLAPTCFDSWFARDCEEKWCSFFFFSPLTVSLPFVSHALSLFFFFFLFPLCFFLLSFFFHLTHRFVFYFRQVRGSFLSLYNSSRHVSPFPWSMYHMDTCSRWHSPHHMALIPCVLLPWCHVATLVMSCGTTPCVTQHPMPRKT